MDTFFILSAKYFFLLPLMIFGGYFLTRPWSSQKRILLFALPSLLLAYLAARLGGSLYDDPRPFVIDHFTPLIPHTPDNGFPSDHALLVSAIAAVGSYLHRGLALALWALALLVSLARVYVGLHHPLDVIGSIVMATLAASVVYMVFTYVWHQEVV